MIRIHRPAEVPAILSVRGQQKTLCVCTQYDANPSDYDHGVIKLPTPDRKIYGTESVRNALGECQANKCCYTEAIFVRDSVHVEHIRPKGAIGLSGTTNKRYPGYYWLAYEWSNLLLCKAGVNADKKDFFPLLDEAARAVNHHHNINQEKPTLIDPASEDPRDHIRFHNEVPYGITERGKYTVSLLLLHDDLRENRLRRFQILEALKKSFKILRHKEDKESMVVKGVRELLKNATRPDAEYSSMAIDLLSDIRDLLKCANCPVL